MELQRQRILLTNIEDEMKDSYLDYSMSVIVSRALPDVRDGLKPVHRRVLYAITIVRMVQDFSLRYPLIDGQGNFGSVDGDSPAAMRYTEVRLERLAGEMLRDLNKDTVDWRPNFDESLMEPVVLPAVFPNLLCNGSAGIAVGMATNVPPHNLCEVVDAVIATIDNPDISVEELMKHIKGPDFPTAGIIFGSAGIKEAYTTGRGKIILRGRATIEHTRNNRSNIIINELPYQVNKSSFIEKTADLVRNKKIEGIARCSTRSRSQSVI